MTWWREWGATVDTLESVVARGGKVKALETRPLLLAGLDLYMTAYNDLLHDKPANTGDATIPWSSIVKWCEIHQIHAINDIDVCVRHVRSLEKADNAIGKKRGS